jgi:GNAT superfamily N-acetyltransferase
MRDSSALAEVYVASRTESMPWLPSGDSHDTIAKWFKSTLIPISEVEIAEFDGEIVGFSSRLNDKLDHLYVHPDHQGKGYGTTMLDEVKKALPTGFDVWVFSENAKSKAFLEKRGCALVRESDGMDKREKTAETLYQWKPN